MRVEDVFVANEATGVAADLAQGFLGFGFRNIAKTMGH